MDWIKTVHVSCVVLSILGFCLRAIWSLLNSPMLERKIVKITPHVIDTLLLISALYLVFFFRVQLMDQPWLVAKILGLLVYIGLGKKALTINSSTFVKVTSMVGAVLVYIYIVSAAVTKSAWGFFGVL